MDEEEERKEKECEFFEIECLVLRVYAFRLVIVMFSAWSV